MLYQNQCDICIKINSWNYILYKICINTYPQCDKYKLARFNDIYNNLLTCNCLYVFYLWYKNSLITISVLYTNPTHNTYVNRKKNSIYRNYQIKIYNGIYCVEVSGMVGLFFRGTNYCTWQFLGDRNQYLWNFVSYS